MGERISSKRSEHDKEEPEVSQEFPVDGQAQAAETDIDAMLDEIDGVLEKNAEEFVNGFIQKGGQ